MSSQLSRIHRLDVHSLRLFATVAKDGSITRAAERNHIAASALSRRLAELEQVVGAPLLVRSRKGAHVTDVGRVVLQHAERIQDELRCLLEDASAALNAQTAVRLCASHSTVGGALPELLRAFRPGAEHVRIEITEASSMEVIFACADAAADIGIGLGVRAPLPEGVEGWTLWTDRLQVVLREDHLLARHPRLRYEQVLAFPIIGSNPAGALSQQLRQEAAALGIAFSAQVTAANFSAGCRLAESGLGLAVMPGCAIPARLPAPLVTRPLLEPWACRPLTVYAGTKQARTRACATLVQHLRTQSRIVSPLRHDQETTLPAPWFEPQFPVATALPRGGSCAVGSGIGFVRPAELHEP